VSFTLADDRPPMNATARDQSDAGLAERVAALESDHGLLMALVHMLTAA
jgi:hypothetical protein